VVEVEVVVVVVVVVEVEVEVEVEVVVVELARVARSAEAQASRTISVRAEPPREARNLRLDMPRRRANTSASALARRMASRTTGEAGGGTNSPFDAGPNLMGRPPCWSCRRRIPRSCPNVAIGAAASVAA
jgi:hypothetical protein